MHIKWTLTHSTARGEAPDLCFAQRIVQTHRLGKSILSVLVSRISFYLLHNALYRLERVPARRWATDLSFAQRIVQTRRPGKSILSVLVSRISIDLLHKALYRFERTGEHMLALLPVCWFDSATVPQLCLSYLQ